MTSAKLDRQSFDSIVTGDLTHHALWLEEQIEGVIADHFVIQNTKSDFERLILRRDGLTFQSKIEICQAMIPLFTDRAAAAELKLLLAEVLEMKRTRNALAHGRDITPSGAAELEIHIETVDRLGRERAVVITEASHKRMLTDCESLLQRLKAVRVQLK